MFYKINLRSIQERPHSIYAFQNRTLVCTLFPREEEKNQQPCHFSENSPNVNLRSSSRPRPPTPLIRLPPPLSPLPTPRPPPPFSSQLSTHAAAHRTCFPRRRRSVVGSRARSVAFGGATAWEVTRRRCGDRSELAGLLGTQPRRP